MRGRETSEHLHTMPPSTVLRLLVVAAVFLFASARLRAGGVEMPPISDKGPRFLNLRYDEDYSYLDDFPEQRGDDPRMKLKNIHLDDDWRLDFGGEFRLRMDSRTNAFLGRESDTHNNQQFYRWLLHADLKYRDAFRLFAQGIVAHAEDQDGPFAPTQENHGDVQQLFADFRLPADLTLRVGRQELAYGVERLVGPLDWVSTRRRFDGVKLMYRGSRFDVDAFWTRPVMVRRESADAWNENSDFYGIYATYRGGAQPPKGAVCCSIHGGQSTHATGSYSTLDGYFFGLNRYADTVNPNGRSGDLSVYTLGTRFAGRYGAWDFDAEAAGQWGHWAGDRVHAWSAAIDGGYTFENAPMHPRLGTGIDFTSGDDTPYDDKVGTFNQLFPFDRVCIGILDLIGRQNLTRTYAALDLWPVKDRVRLSTIYHYYFLSEERDALYNASGIPLLRDGKGRSGLAFGSELDIWLDWSMTAWSTLSIGYSHFWDGRYVHDRVRGDDDTDLVLVQYRYRF